MNILTKQNAPIVGLNHLGRWVRGSTRQSTEGPTLQRVTQPGGLPKNGTLDLLEFKYIPDFECELWFLAVPRYRSFD